MAFVQCGVASVRPSGGGGRRPQARAFAPRPGRWAVSTGRRRPPASPAPVSPHSPAPSARLAAAPSSDAALVDELLERLSTTDGGPSTGPDVRAAVDGVILDLCASGRGQTPLADPRLFDRYCVSYTSPGPGQGRRGAPAGGRFRSRIGRALFRSRGLFQHVFHPNCVVNLVAFKLFGLVDGAVGLRGRLTPLGDGGHFGPNGVRVDFEPPRISLAGVVFQFARRSSVQIRTPYLDDRVRIGIGSRGSLFVFTKGGAAASTAAQEWEVLFSDDARGRKLIPAAAIPAAIVGLLACAALLPPPLAVLAVLCTAALGRQSRVKYTGRPAV